MTEIEHLQKRIAYLEAENKRLREQLSKHRSKRSHDHYFAALNDAWEQQSRFPTVEHMRKWALIATGFCAVEYITFDTSKDAVQASVMIKQVDDYAVVSVKDNVIELCRAKSQSLKTMDREEFQKSKQAVLDWAAAMIGVTADQLGSHA